MTRHNCSWSNFDFLIIVNCNVDVVVVDIVVVDVVVVVVVERKHQHHCELRLVALCVVQWQSLPKPLVCDPGNTL